MVNLPTKQVEYFLGLKQPLAKDYAETLLVVASLEFINVKEPCRNNISIEYPPFESVHSL